MSRSTRWAAAASPAGPAPMTTTGSCWVLMMLGLLGGEGSARVSEGGHPGALPACGRPAGAVADLGAAVAEADAGQVAGGAAGPGRGEHGTEGARHDELLASMLVDALE